MTDKDIYAWITSYIHEGQTLGNLSQSTAINRGYELRKFAKFCKSRNVTQVNKIYKNLIIDYLDSLNANKTTKRTIIAILRGYMDFLENNEAVIDNIAASIKQPKIVDQDPDHLTEEEIQRLFSSEEQTAPFHAVDRNLMIYSMLIYLCLRMSELIELKTEDVRINGDKNANEIWIVRKGGDTVVLPLNETLVKRYKNWMHVRATYKGNDSPWVFLSKRGGRLHPRAVRAIVTRGLKRAGISKRKRGPHLLRHSGASLYSKSGENPRIIQHLMGHKNLATTNRYLHFDKAQLLDMVNRCQIVTLDTDSKKATS